MKEDFSYAAQVSDAAQGREAADRMARGLPAIKPKGVVEHQPERHQGCEDSYCNVCEGDLFICTACGCMEGCLPSECPGVFVPADTRDAIYAGQVDYRGGRWVDAPSKHSPAGLASMIGNPNCFR